MQKKWKLFLTIFMIFVVVFIGVKFYIGWAKTNVLEKRIEVLKKKIEIAEKKNNKLKKDLTKIDKPKYIEKVAREKLGLVKPGEILLIPVEKSK